MAKKKEIELKLKPAQVWVIITTIATLLGGSFGFGVKVNNEINKTQIAKVEQKYLKQIGDTELSHSNNILVLTREKNEFKQNMIYYRNQYDIYFKRYETVSNKLNKLMSETE